MYPMKTKTEKKEIIHHPLKLYTDGGVISKNPSPYGGTWAWVLVRDDKELVRESGVLEANRQLFVFENHLVTNNQSELFAIIRRLQQLDSPSAVVEICSDSNVSLGRVFRGSSFHNIPGWMQAGLSIQRHRLMNWSKFSYTLLDGHPTKAQLASGVGKHGHPVSKWNKLCDDLCRAEAENYWKDKNR